MAPELKKTVQNLRQIINEISCTRGLIMNEGEQRKRINRGHQEKWLEWSTKMNVSEKVCNISNE